MNTGKQTRPRCMYVPLGRIQELGRRESVHITVVPEMGAGFTLQDIPALLLGNWHKVEIECTGA